jgi:hypothetical protein
MSDIIKSKKLRRADRQKKYDLKNKQKLRDYQKNYRIKMKEKRSEVKKVI